MSLKHSVVAALFALSLVLAVSAQESGGVIGWFNGNWRSGIPGAWNWYVAPDNFARVYDQFRVPEGGWTVVSVFSDNVLLEFPSVIYASWEIRRGMAPGNGGEVVAAGVTPATQDPDPSVTTPKYPAGEVKKHFRIQVDNLHVQLSAGRCWLSVTPVGKGDAYASATLGANAIGIDQNGLAMALVDSPNSARFAIAGSAAGAGQLGIAQHFAQGVIVAK
jgi:hypothetical protein